MGGNRKLLLGHSDPEASSLSWLLLVVSITIEPQQGATFRGLALNASKPNANQDFQKYKAIFKEKVPK